MADVFSRLSSFAEPVRLFVGFVAAEGQQLFSLVAPHERPSFTQPSAAPGFMVYKLGIYLQVRCPGGKVELTLLEPPAEATHILQQVVRSEHFLAQSFLKLNEPPDALAALMGYFEGKGWEVHFPGVDGQPVPVR